jgi:(4-(4-[2-(gamma-L-glutamylamino)ethyl]phenoxymethyl)furan-2-yl)methanamine synthase
LVGTSGGAHLKAARVKHGRVEAVVQAATPLWLGLDSLDAAFDALSAQLGRADRHVITMTGELCDAFPSRREGVAGLAAIAANHLSPAAPSLYAGRAGFVELGEAASHAVDIASANWHASAALLALKLPDALFIDIGSTTTDIIPIVGGQVAAVGYTDAERLAAGELIYTGMTRSFVMSLASRAPFRGAWTPLMNEYFASSADVHRILGDLPDGTDKMSTADGREKTVEASRARLARMIGREADEGSDLEWTGLAAWFAETQIRQITDAASLRLSRNDVAAAAPVVAAGVGEGLAAEAARRLRRPCLGFSSLISAPAEASHCAPAVAVALLGANREALPSSAESL